MTYKHHTKLDLVEGGNIFKQGDHPTLKFIGYDSLGNEVDLSGKQIEGSLFSRNKGIIYEAPASFTDDRIVFTINEVLDNGDFQLEFTVTDSADPDYRAKFPSDEYAAKLTIKPSKDNMDFVGVSMTTVAQLKSELQGLQTEFAGQVLPRVDIVEDKQMQLEADYQAAAGALTEDSEVILARKGEPNLRAFNDKVVAQLAETEAEVKRKRELEDLSPTVLSAIEGGEGTSFNLLSVPQDGSTTPKKTTFAKAKNKFDGNYFRNARLVGSTSAGFAFGERVGAITVLFKGEKGKTYTLSKSLNVDSHGVAVYVGNPEIGAFATRSLNDNTGSWASFTVTLQGEEDYIVINVSSESQQVFPEWFQIEEGANQTPYSPPDRVAIDLEKGSVNSDSLDLSGIQFKPENTTFAQPGKNKWNGLYEMNRSMGGSLPNLAYRNTPNAISVVFEGEKGKTYTISKSNDTDRHGVAVNAGVPIPGTTTTRSINGNTTPFSELTVTLQGEENYIIVHLSSDTQSQTPAWFQIEEGTAATSYSKPNAVKIILENEDETEETGATLIHAKRTGDIIDIFKPSKSTPNRFLRFRYERVIDPAKNTDSWLQTTTAIFNKNNGVYNLAFNVGTSGDQEGVLRVTGEGDFVGGGFHGHEMTQNLNIIIDGKDYTNAGNFDLECANIQIVQSSTVYHHNTTTKAFQKYKKSEWSVDDYAITGKWIAEDETSIMTSKVGIFSVIKSDSGKTVIKWGRNDSNYEKVNVSGDFSATQLMTQKRTDTKKQELWSEEENFYVGLTCEYDRNKYTGNHYVEDFGGRAKIYFDIGAFVMQAGEMVEYRNVFDFRY